MRFKSEMKKSLYPGASQPKICFLLESYYPIVGGMEVSAKALADSLAIQGFPVTVITRRTDPGLEKAERLGEVEVYRIPPVGQGHLKRWGMVMTSVFTLVRRQRRYDIIFVSGFRALGLSAVLMSKMLGKTCVLKADNNGEMSGEFFLGGLKKLHLSPSSILGRAFISARNTVLRRADRFVSISSDMTEEFTDCGVDPSKVHYIPNSVDISRFYPVTSQKQMDLRCILGLPLGKKIMVFTGRLVSWKGLPLLLQVWERIRENHPTALLLMVGSGGSDMYNCENELREFVRSHNLQNSVCFTGEVGNVHEYLQASDIFVFPTEDDAFGLSLIEAMACGLPVITTGAGGIKDVIIANQNGLMIEARNFGQLQSAIESLLTNESLVISLGSAARKTVKSRYSQESIVNKYMKIFQDVGTSN